MTLWKTVLKYELKLTPSITLDSICSDSTFSSFYSHTHDFFLTYPRMFVKRKYEYFYGQELFMQVCICTNVYTFNIFQGLFLSISVNKEAEHGVFQKE